MKKHIVAALAGALFAGGLALSAMTDPGKVIAFLDVTGAWDPSLAFVMAGAIAVHFLGARWSRTAPGPLLGGAFVLPKAKAIDIPLVAGSALFGLGWGVAGYCPGPALVSATGLSGSALAFVAAMLVGTEGLSRTKARRCERCSRTCQGSPPACPEARASPVVDSPISSGRPNVDSGSGERSYLARCASCHGADGAGRRNEDGTPAAPPLRGARSFNIGAGMARLDTAAAFVHENMPLGAPDKLTTWES